MKKGFLIGLCFLWCSVVFCEESGIPHPRMRTMASPRNGESVNRNPAPLLWPAAGGANGARYVVRLAPDAAFSGEGVIYSDTIPWAMYTPHRKLSTGVWHWQYASLDENNRAEWSPVYTFRITTDSEVFDTPSVREFLQTVEGLGLPRMMVSAKDLPAFRERNRNHPDATAVLKAADKNLNRPLLPEAPTRPRDTVGVSGWEKETLMRFMYHRFGETVRIPVETQALAYLLTGEEKYAREALRQAMHIAGMDPKGWATSEDFNSASALLAMATAWDVGREGLSPEEKDRLKEAILKRGNQFFRQYCNRFEAQSMDNHVWQHTLRRFFLTALAMADDLPEARQWLAYTYEVWCCRFPILGGVDGGWHDGSSYYPVNFETFILMPLRLKQLTGVDFFNIAWYRNAPYFLIYSFPENSFSTGFGDGYEEMTAPTSLYAAYADALARETNNGHVRYYADRIAAGKKPAPAFRLYRLLTASRAEDVKPVPLDDLPSARCFPDAGFALMHSDLAHTENNLMASFMSVPFGATGHAHAAHNGFTLSYGGKQLFGGSGYYSHFNDPHTLMHYRTRGHNTILADGMAQVIGENGYGQIVDFVHTPEKTVATGDATHAYGKMTSAFWLDRMEKSGVAYTPENGFGDPGITRFVRRFEFIPPDKIIIRDELEADEPRAWTWLLHSYQPMSATKEGELVVIQGENEKAKARVSIRASEALTASVSDRFFSPALNWKKREKDGKTLEYKPHWHAEVQSTKKTNKIAFLVEIDLVYLP